MYNFLPKNSFKHQSVPISWKQYNSYFQKKLYLSMAERNPGKHSRIWHVQISNLSRTGKFCKAVVIWFESVSHSVKNFAGWPPFHPLSNARGPCNSYCCTVMSNKQWLRHLAGQMMWRVGLWAPKCSPRRGRSLTWPDRKSGRWTWSKPRSACPEINKNDH